MNKVIIMLVLLTTSITLKAQNMDTLDNRQKYIGTIAVNTSIGNLNTLKSELSAGLEHGLSINEINEVLIQMYAYCGFPRSLQAINTFMALVEERKLSGINDAMGNAPAAVTEADKYKLGKDNLQKLTGITETTPSGANAFAPGIDVFLKEHLFADIFSRGILSFSDRELATVSALIGLGGVEPQLRSHFRMAINTGLSNEQLQELIEILKPFVGNEKARIANDLLSGRAQEKDEAPSVSDFPLGNENTGYAAYFSGKSWLAPLTSNKTLKVPMSNVTFEPGCRNNWHTHTGGQILIAVGGIGYYQERGKAAVRMLPGDVIEIAPNIEHWHGAAPDSWFSHLAIACNPETNENVWLEPVGKSSSDCPRKPNEFAPLF